jgi:ketosteroid isomerase-like protein
MSIETNIQIVKDFLAAIGRGDKNAMFALAAEDIECQSARKRDPLLECAPTGGQNQAGVLTVWRAC